MNTPIEQTLADDATGRHEQRKQAAAKFEYKFHPLADCLPLMEGDEFKALVSDISRHGLRYPITIYEGEILDGRNRYRACREAPGFKFKPEDFVQLPIGSSPVDFIISTNVNRRHWNESQRAITAAKLVNTTHGDNQHTRKVGPSIGVSSAAKLLNVSEKSVERARVVLKKGTPELQALVERGEVAASVAAKVADKFPKEKQAELVESGADAIREAAKKVRTTTTTTKRQEKSSKDLKKQGEDFAAAWDELNGTQKRHFVKTHWHELGELREEVEGEVEAEDEAAVAQQ